MESAKKAAAMTRNVKQKRRVKEIRSVWRCAPWIRPASAKTVMKMIGAGLKNAR
jgi:hypothetical protein